MQGYFCLSSILFLRRFYSSFQDADVIQKIESMTKEGKNIICNTLKREIEEKKSKLNKKKSPEVKKETKKRKASKKGT